MVTKNIARGWDKEILHQVNEREVKELSNRLRSEDFANAISNPETMRTIRREIYKHKL
jgi:ribosomal protein L29